MRFRLQISVQRFDGNNAGIVNLASRERLQPTNRRAAVDCDSFVRQASRPVDQKGARFIAHRRNG